MQVVTRGNESYTQIPPVPVFVLIWVHRLWILFLLQGLKTIFIDCQPNHDTKTMCLHMEESNQPVNYWHYFWAINCLILPLSYVYLWADEAADSGHGSVSLRAVHSTWQQLSRDSGKGSSQPFLKIPGIDFLHAKHVLCNLVTAPLKLSTLGAVDSCHVHWTASLLAQAVSKLCLLGESVIFGFGFALATNHTHRFSNGLERLALIQKRASVLDSLDYLSTDLQMLWST